jgi:hypothetical protein
VPASPRHELDHVVVADLDDELVLAEMLEQVPDLALGVVRASMMLPNLNPVTISNVVEPQ